MVGNFLIVGVVRDDPRFSIEKQGNNVLTPQLRTKGCLTVS